MASNSQYTLSPIWQKAVIAGTFWGALEIILGSILHNLMLPLAAGTVLSFAGVTIVTAISIQNPERGLYWRAALVCAMLKSVSPSVVIITPMIGIMLEGIFIEVGVLLLGRNFLGVMLGGGLAVLTVPVFKILRLFMMYGSGIYGLYLSVFGVSNSELRSVEPTYWPLVGIGTLYVLLGFLAVIVGYSLGKGLKNTQWVIPEMDGVGENRTSTYSIFPITSFLLHFAFLVIFLTYMSKMPTLISLMVAGSYIAFTVLFYPRARFPFKKLGLLVSMAVFSFTIPFISVRSFTDISWLENGGKIMMRALLVLVSFAAIGTELAKPAVKAIFSRGVFRPAYMATTLAFNSLPEYVGKIRSFELRGGNPVVQIKNLVSNALLVSQAGVRQYPFIVVVGERGAGKTSFIKKVVEQLIFRNIRFAGFYATGLGDSTLRTGYSLVLLPENRTMALCQRVAECGTPQQSFKFDDEAVREGESVMAKISPGEVAIIDEIGQMELNGKVWFTAFNSIMRKRINPVIVTVRKSNLESVLRCWEIQNPVIVDIKKGSPEDVVKLLQKWGDESAF
ncbi:MAG: nucleoside-triphosphatase [Bacteroidales bacterium]